MVNRIHLNRDAYKGDKNHGGVDMALLLCFGNGTMATTRNVVLLCYFYVLSTICFFKKKENHYI